MSELLVQLRAAISESGHSRYAISKATGIDQGHLSNLMSGKAGLSLENLEKICGFLGLEIIIKSAKKMKGR